jgi:hypothetical protein
MVRRRQVKLDKHKDKYQIRKKLAYKENKCAFFKTRTKLYGGLARTAARRLFSKKLPNCRCI